MVTRALLAVAILLTTGLAAPGVARAQDDEAGASSGASSRSGFGLGVYLGEPSAATAKFYLDEASAIQIHAGWTFRRGGILIILDYLYHFDPIALESPTLDLPLYIGGGARFLQIPGAVENTAAGENSKFQFGIHLPIGIAAAFKKFPLEVFLEVAPGLRIVSSTDWEIDAGLGVRWYF